MIEYESPQLDAVFHALADPTRRAMLHTLSSQPLPVGQLAAPFEMSLAAASKHIQVLERAGLVQRTVTGRTHLCQLNAAPMHAGLEWMRHYERFWQQRWYRVHDRGHRFHWQWRFYYYQWRCKRSERGWFCDRLRR